MRAPWPRWPIVAGAIALLGCNGDVPREPQAAPGQARPPVPATEPKGTPPAATDGFALLLSGHASLDEYLDAGNAHMRLRVLYDGAVVTLSNAAHYPREQRGVLRELLLTEGEIHQTRQLFLAETDGTPEEKRAAFETMPAHQVLAERKAELQATLERPAHMFTIKPLR